MSFRKTGFYRKAGIAILGMGMVMSLGLAATTMTAAPASAQSVKDFFAQKQRLILLAGTRPGGSYGLYGKIIAPYMSKYIPGNPKIVMNFMPGAGGGKAANYMYNVAPKDGSWMLLSHAISLLEKLRGKGIRFESGKMQWLGSFSQITQLMTVWYKAPVTTLADMKKTPLVISAFSKSHATFQWPMLLNNTIGTKFKIIVGYRGGATNNLAMERGETDGWTPSWGNLNGTRPEWLRDKKVRIVAQFGLDPVAELSNVPMLIDLVPRDKRDIVEFLTSSTPISRGIAVAPEVPKDRVAALRRAFTMTMKDPEFIAEIKKRNLTLRPRTGPEVAALVNKIVNAPPELVNKVKAAISGSFDKKPKKKK
jgi:tripartite-type tricarboxylate transporter receptor subunit TctC